MWTLVLLALAGPPGGASINTVPIPYGSEALCRQAGEKARAELMPRQTGGLVTFTCLPGSTR